MKKILIQVPGLDGGSLFDADARDGVQEPFIYLRSKLREIGYQLESADDKPVEGCERILFWDVPVGASPAGGLRSWAGVIKDYLLRREPKSGRRDLYQDCIRAGMQSQLALIIGEPPVVFPHNWDAAAHHSFPVILTWNDEYVDGKKFFKFNWPLTSWFPEIPQVPFTQKKLLVNISGNKFSPHPDELYSARCETIRHFEACQAGQFDLYGTGWDEPRPGQLPYSSYRGTPKHKWDIYPNYRFGLCYENMRGVSGWVTEKIFDCMRANCVPVYWGASNITDFVDPQTFIDRTHFKTNEELEDFLINVSEREYMGYQLRIREYLMSDRFASFLPPAFSHTIIRTLKL